MQRWLRNLHLEKTYELTFFNAYQSGPDNFNQTFPLLETAHFAYHAHCCQLKIGQGGESHQYYELRNGGGASPVVQRAAAIFKKIRSLFRRSVRVIRQVSTDLNYTCVNLTSRECIYDVNSNVNISDSSIVSIQDPETFCNSTEFCLSCLQDVCTNGCSITTNSSMEPVYNHSVICIPIVQSVTGTASVPISTVGPSPPGTSMFPSPTPTPTLSSPVPVTSDCLSSSRFSTHIARNVCTSSPPTSTPIPTTTPMPIDVCTPQYCSSRSTDSFEVRNCESCQDSDCDLGDCDQYRDVDRFCHCQLRKKRSASFADNHEAIQLPLKDKKQRNKRSMDPDRNCTAELLVTCSNCTSWSVLPSGWFYPEPNNIELICTEELSPTMPSTTNPPVTVPGTHVETDKFNCSREDLSGYVKKGRTMCFPIPDAFNPCIDLLNEDHYLRVAIWFVIFLAFIGNGLVILVFIIYSCIIRRTEMDLFIMHFFYFNLALADFLMCIYLLTIAAEDLSTVGKFSLYDIEWRIGFGCNFAGFCAILSTVVSVYVLTVITVERAYTIINAMHRKRVNKKAAFIIMGIGWALGILLAILPLPGVGVSDYSSVAICLPFNVETPLSKSYVVFLLLATGIAFLVVAVAYVIIFCHIFCRRSLAYPSNNRRATEVKIAIRMFILVFTNFICWFPIALVSLASVFGDGIVHDIEFAKWAIVFILPINSCFNPVLYSISTRVFRENFIIVLSKLRLCRSKASQIRNRRKGITPSYISQNSSSVPNMRRPTIIDRLRLLSLSSQGSSTDLSQRRDSNLSHVSDPEMYRIALINTHRRSSAFSTTSSDEPLYNTKIRRGSSGTSLDDPCIIPNPAFRASSPVGATVNIKPRVGPKISASSLGPVPEEGETMVAPTVDPNVVKVNPAYEDDDEEVIKHTGVTDNDSGQYTNEQTVNYIGNDVGITSDGSVGYAQHQIVAESEHYNDSEENDSGHSENFSASPSINEFSQEQQKESAVEEIEFD